MRNKLHWFIIPTVFAGGFVAGSLNTTFVPELRAQDAQESAALTRAMKDMNRAVRSAKDALNDEGRYTSAMKSVNMFAVSCGGLDVMSDLESGKGVDPETFAALYAGDASAAVVDKLGRDDQGRLTYNNKVVRLYSEARLKQLFAERARFGNGGN